MKLRVEVYVAVVCTMAIATAVCVVVFGPQGSIEHLPAAFCFASLGVLAHWLGHRLPGGASGSIAFLPFLALLLVVPNWIALAAVSMAMACVELASRKSLIKATFNVAQVTLAVGLCILAYDLTGGEALRGKEDLSWLVTARFAVCFFLFIVSNSIAVSGVIGIAEGRSLLQVWRSNTRLSLLYDFLSFPFVFVFAVVYIEYGVAGAAVLALQMLGVRQLYKTNSQLEKANQELLQLMVAAIEARDPYTSGHSKRVARYAHIISRAIGLSSKQAERIEVAALLHDVGKIHEVFAPLLRKAAKLTDEEMAVMMTHSTKSAELVAHVSQLSDVVEVVRHHHENWDGTGYPAGLSGDQIPLGSRVIIFADTVDAMTSDRPYRAALGEAQVRSELRRMRGRQFDPEICDLLLSSPMFKDIFRQQHHVLQPQPEMLPRAIASAVGT